MQDSELQTGQLHSRLDFRITTLLNPALPASEATDPHGLKSILDRLWPATQSLESPLATPFLGLRGGVEEIPQGEWVLARDGLLPLFLFFLGTPEPTAFRGKLLVPAELKALVPAAWERCTRAYRLASARPAPVAKTGRSPLTVCGMNMEINASIEEFVSALQPVRAAFDAPASEGARKLRCMIRTSNTGLGTDPNHSFNPRLIQELVAALPGVELEWLGLPPPMADDEAEEGFFVEVNPSVLVSCSYFSWAMLARGLVPLEAGAPFGAAVGMKVDQVIPASAHHMVEVAPLSDTSAPSYRELMIRLSSYVSRLPEAVRLVKHAMTEAKW